MPEPGAPAHLCNSFIYLEIVASLRELGWKCQRASASELVACQFSGTRKERMEASASLRKGGKDDYEKLREMPSLLILSWRVDLFIPSFAAAPLGPATTQLDCFKALRIC